MRLKEAKRIINEWHALAEAMREVRRVCVKTTVCTNYTQARELFPDPELTNELFDAYARDGRRAAYSRRHRRWFGSGPMSFVRVYRRRKSNLAIRKLDQAFCDLDEITEIGGASTLSEARSYFKKHKVSEC